MLPHPSFVPGTTPRTQPGADLALLRLARRCPRDIEPLTLGGGLWQGETVTMAGFGLAVENNKKTARRLRETRLVNAGNYTTANTVKVAVDTESQGREPRRRRLPRRFRRTDPARRRRIRAISSASSAGRAAR